MLPEDRRLTAEEIEGARRLYGEYRAAAGLTHKAVAREIGISEGVLVSFHTGNYRGDREKIARKLVRWQRQHEAGQRAGLPEQMITTGVVEEMLAVITNAKATKSIALIMGPSGTSKTMVCKAAAQLIPGTIRLEMGVVTRSPVAFLRTLARAVNVSHKLAGTEMFQRIVAQLQGTNRLIIVDEAAYLTRESINCVRDLHKQAEVPIVLVGTKDIAELVNDFTEFYGQLERLISFALNISEKYGSTDRPLFTVEEVVEFATTMKLRLTPDGAERLTELCCIPGWGGLGKARNVLLNARMLSKNKAVTAKHINSAIRQMTGVAGLRRVEQRVERRREAVA